MTNQSRLQLTDAAIERMLAERAGQSAPVDLVHTIAVTAESTAQRAPGLLGAVVAPWTARRRRVPATLTSRRVVQVAAVAIAVVVVVTGAGLVLRQSPAVVGGPSVAPIVASPSATAGPSSSPSPSPSPSATPRPAAVIAFIKYVDRSNPMSTTPRVWIVGADGTSGHELIPGGTGRESGVAWSPDGTHLIYSEDGRLYLTDSNGTAPQVVDTGCGPGFTSRDAAFGDRDAAFSRDGTQLVFEHGCTGRIATMNLASGRVVDLDSTHFYSVRPRWSPDGTQIVFSTDYKSDGGPAVFVVDTDGQNLRQLTPASLPGRFPSWSPDGSRIVFTSYVAKILGSGAHKYETLDQDVYAVRPDWTDLRRLTSDGISIGATWTPDGRILYGRLTHDEARGEGSLWSMDADGANAKRIVSGVTGTTGQPYLGFDAAWQPTP